MPKLKLSDLRRDADALLEKGETLAAVRIFVELLRKVPRDYRGRLSLADALARADHAEEAVRVYRATAELCIEGGWPLSAVVAIRAVEALERPADDLIDRIAEVYNRDSERVGSVGARMNVHYPDDLSLKTRSLREEKTVAELIEEAVEVGSSAEGVGELPPCFPPVALLSRLSRERLAAVLRAVWVHRLPVGHALMQRGERGTSCFLVADGKVRVSAPDDVGEERELAVLGPGSLVGEMALITGSPRVATVVIVEPADVIELGPEALAAIGEDLDQLAPVLDQLAQNRWMKNLLEQSPLFRVFAPPQRQQLLQRCSAYDVPGGTTLFSEGEPSKGIYLLLRGELQLRRSSGKQLPVWESQLSAGAMAGVSSTMRDRAASCTAVTLVPATVLFLSRRAVWKLRDAVPEFAAELEKVARRREAEIEEADIEAADTIVD